MARAMTDFGAAITTRKDPRLIAGPPGPKGDTGPTGRGGCQDFQTMTREGVPVGDLEIEIGRLRGALEATQTRQDRDMAAMTAQMERERVAVNARFADIKKQLDGQDTKLDVLMRKQDEAVGAREEQKKWLGTWFKVLTVLIPLTAILLELFRWKLL